MVEFNLEHSNKVPLLPLYSFRTLNHNFFLSAHDINWILPITSSASVCTINWRWTLFCSLALGCQLSNTLWNKTKSAFLMHFSLNKMLASRTSTMVIKACQHCSFWDYFTWVIHIADNPDNGALLTAQNYSLAVLWQKACKVRNCLVKARCLVHRFLMRFTRFTTWACQAVTGMFPVFQFIMGLCCVVEKWNNLETPLRVHWACYIILSNLWGFRLMVFSSNSLDQCGPSEIVKFSH